MKILITGARGFIGKNLVATLENIQTGKDRSFGVFENLEIFSYDRQNSLDELREFCSQCDFVFHLAGVNRPETQDEFMKGNAGFFSMLLDLLRQYNNPCPVMLSSSIQAELDNPYGVSKKAGEECLLRYGEETGAPVYLYRFPNVFGKWCRPNYNSVVATFCYNIARQLPIQVNNPATQLNLVYIDDVVTELVGLLSGKVHRDEAGFAVVPTVYHVTLKEITDLLYSFRQSRTDKRIPDMTENSFSKKMYSTYLSYLPEDQFSYPLTMNVDTRGSFTEIFRTADRGQLSVNISKPGITKGEHWHHTKNEKFIVVSGQGRIQFRKVGEESVIEVPVSGDKIEVVDIPTGYTHNIINDGDTDLVTIMWCNECFNPDKPDTYALKVKGEDQE